MKEEQPDAVKEKGKLSFSRREFLQATGGGIVIFFTFSNLAA